MKRMKKFMIVLAAFCIIASAGMTAFAAGPGESRVYWGIDGGTLVISNADTGLSTGGAFDSLAAFDPAAGRPWLPYREGIRAVRVDGSAGKVKIRDCMDLFYGLSSLTDVDLSGLDTGAATSMWCMFDGCTSLKKADVSMLDTSNVVNMQGMFYECSSLESVDLKNFDTGKVTNMYSMFAGCTELVSADLSGFDMSNVKNATDMFAGCDKLSEIKTGAGWTADGAPVIASWKKAGENTWFCVDMKGNRLTGWQKLWWNNNEDWYYFSREPGASYGVCQLGGVTPDGFTLFANGAWTGK